MELFLAVMENPPKNYLIIKTEPRIKLEMWANAQLDSHPAEYIRRPLFNAAKFG